MIALLAMAIGFGAVVAFSPTKLAISILYLSGHVAPVARAVAFTVGNSVVLVAVAGLAMAGDDLLLDPAAGRPNAADWLDLTFGLLLIAVGAYGLARPGAVGPAALGIGESDLRPRLGRAAAFGASYAFVAFGRLVVIAAGGAWIARSPVDDAGRVALMTLMLVVAQFPLWFPILVKLVAPDRMTRISGLTDRSIQHIGGRTSAAIVVAIGGVLVLAGLDWLIL